MKVLDSSQFSLNGMQICRLVNGAKGKHDIKFCTGGKKDKWKGVSNFKSHGNKPYPHCNTCEWNASQVYYHLKTLEKQDVLESRIEFRTDPILITRKDRMRMWARKGGLPTLDRFLK